MMYVKSKVSEQIYIVDDIAHKMKDDDIIQKTCNLF